MKKIASFTVNHDTLEKGVYISRIDGDAVTYDIRMKKPNNGSFISPKSLHTIEHLLATYVRNSEYSDSIIYAGPMGCRSGFYLIVRDSVSKADVLALIKSSFEFIANFSGEIPGSSRAECGNYLEHDLEAAVRDAAEYNLALKDVTENDMQYKA
jgi:S-ribosylhomocysteine lyase